MFCDSVEIISNDAFTVAPRQMALLEDCFEAHPHSRFLPGHEAFQGDEMRPYRGENVPNPVRCDSFLAC